MWIVILSPLHYETNCVSGSKIYHLASNLLPHYTVKYECYGPQRVSKRRLTARKSCSFMSISSFSSAPTDAADADFVAADTDFIVADANFFAADADFVAVDADFVAADDDFVTSLSPSAVVVGGGGFAAAVASVAATNFCH